MGREQSAMAGPDSTIAQAYQLAREQYATLGVDVDLAVRRLKDIAVSVHCWQGDDVAGFEATGAALSGGIAVTGAYSRAGLGRWTNSGPIWSRLTP